MTEQPPYGGPFRAVIFDWRGTLVWTPTLREWVQRTLTSLGRSVADEDIDAAVMAIERANGAEDRLDGPGVDADAALHRRVYLRVFADAGLDDELALALYASEPAPENNLFADDVHETLAALRRTGLRVAVLSDIHVDIRPAFDAAGLAGLVDVFTLSFEQGIQKPDPAMFMRTLAALQATPDEVLMVGDRSRPDGAAVELGITTLLLPPLRSPHDSRLHRVLALCP